MKKPENFVELYAWCIASFMTGPTDGVQVMHLYRVVAFVEDDRFYPYGLMLRDYRGNDLSEIFYRQQFILFEIYMN